jgi:hypothetical protein
MKKLGLAAALLFMTTSAHASIGILGGASFHNVSTDPSVSFNSHAGLLAGLAFSSELPLINLEVDALYDNRSLSVLGTSFSSPAIQIPVLARFSVIPLILDFGIGPYASFNVGTNDLGYKSPDIGIVGSVRLIVPTPGIHLVVDGRYNFGIANLSQVALTSVHTREVQILAGIDIPFMN